MFDEKPKNERASAPMFSEKCMRLDCNNKTDVVIRNGGNVITRCCQCYDQDLRRAGRNQLRVNEAPYRQMAENEMRGKLGAVLKEIANRQRAA